MTTVAWDGTTMAADSLGNFCGRRVQVWKVRRVYLPGPPGSFVLVGYAGNEAVGEAMIEWIAGGRDASQRPRLQDEDAMSCHVLEVDPHGTCWLHTKGGRSRITDRFLAVGSGSDYATAAMALGKTAEEAVELAIRFDVNSGGPVQTVSFA